MNIVVNLSLPLVTRLASFIQLERREREIGTTYDALSLQQSRAGRESHWFDIKRSKNHRFGDSRTTLFTPACFFFIFFFDKPNFVNLGKLGPSLPSLTDFYWVWSSLLIFEFFYLISHVIFVLTNKIIRLYDFMSQLPFDNHVKDHHSAAEKKGNLSRTGLLTREPIAIRWRNFGFLDTAKTIKTKVINSVSFRPE